MVDVSPKVPTRREAIASAFVALKRAVLKQLPKNPKGDPLEVARLAGIMAAKRTSELIPMCHPLPLSHVDVDMRLCENGVAITSKVTTTAVTGVEMEALVAASVAALTVYDMCKALDKGIEAYNQKKIKDAETLLQKAVEAKPDFALAHFWLGMVSFNLNKKPAAREHLEKYLSLDPNGSEAATAKEILPLVK